MQHTPALTLADAILPRIETDSRVSAIVRDLALMVGFAAFVAVCAQVQVRLPWTTVPITGQTFAALVTGGALGANAWLMKGYFDTIPIEIEEAAMMDGCGPLQAFIRVAIPMVLPAIAVTAILAFLSGWGDFVFASVLVPAPDAKKLAVPALYSMANSMSVPWGQFAAGATIVVVPTIIVFLLAQNLIQSGLTAAPVDLPTDHGFDIPTGACLVDATVRVKTYPVTVEDGQVVVSYTD